MKKFSIIIMAIALVLGMAQCKKQETPDTPSQDLQWVTITMKIDEGNKHQVFPSTGAVVYTNGDKIYVSNGGKYRGVLTFSNGAFTGDLAYNSEKPMDTNDKLHFYFLGGASYTEPTALQTTEFEVNISDQSSNLPVLSCGQSSQNYTDGIATYSCTLENKCGLVKVVLPTAADVVTLGGMKNVAVVDFENPGITPANIVGNITPYAVSESEKWAILLPQNAVNNEIRFGMSIYAISVPQIEENDFVTSGVTIGAQLPTFTVSATEVVRFSTGNLQYKDGTGWRIAENQYDIVGAWNTGDWVDLFGWGTWGHGKNPLNVSTNNADYEWSTDFEGVIDGISGWRTLSGSEWKYLIEDRTDASSKRGRAEVHGVRGALIFPDNFTMPAGISFTPGSGNGNTGWYINEYTDEQWSALEAAGALFLPAAGQRDGETVSFNGQYGYYWSNSGGSDMARPLRITINIETVGWMSRYLGFSVRLVR